MPTVANGARVQKAMLDTLGNYSRNGAPFVPQDLMREVVTTLGVENDDALQRGSFVLQ